MVPGTVVEAVFLTSEKIVEVFSILLNVFQPNYINIALELQNSVEPILSQIFLDQWVPESLTIHRWFLWIKYEGSGPLLSSDVAWVSNHLPKLPNSESFT